MSEKKTIDPHKIIIREFKIAKANLECPDDFQVQNIASFTSDVNMETECSLEDSLIKAVLVVSVGTVNSEESEEVRASFRFVFIYHYEHLSDHAVKNSDGVALGSIPGKCRCICNVFYIARRVDITLSGHATSGFYFTDSGSAEIS